MVERPEQYVAKLDEWGAVWQERGDDRTVVRYEEVDDEYERIRDGGAGLVDRMARGTLVVSGEDAVPWLQGLVTNDLLDLQEVGRGQWNCTTNVNGRMVADLRILHLPEMLVLDLEPGVLSAGYLSHLHQQIIMEDVTLDDRTESTGRFGVYGPAAAEIIESAGEWNGAVEELEPHDGVWGEIAGREVIVQAIDLTGGPGYDLSFDRREAFSIWERLEEAGGEQLRPVGEDALETARIEAGVPRFGRETSDEVIPLEAGLRGMISFDKGCYVGQEIIARLDTRGTPAKRLRTLVFDGGAAPHEGAEVMAGEREAGEVVSSVWSPRAEGPIALAYVKRRHYEVGGTVEVEGRSARVEQLGYALARQNKKAGNRKQKAEGS